MADVESVASSVVREYLSRKGLKDTLAVLDREMPRTDTCINNRAQLAKELHISGLMKKNKECLKNFRTMLEVIVQFMMAKTWLKQFSEQNSKDILPRKPEHVFDSLDLSSKETEKNVLNETGRSRRRNGRAEQKNFERSPTASVSNEIKAKTDSRLALTENSGLSSSSWYEKSDRTRTRTTSSETFLLDIDKKSEHSSDVEGKFALNSEWDIRNNKSHSSPRSRRRLGESKPSRESKFDLLSSGDIVKKNPQLELSEKEEDASSTPLRNKTLLSSSVNSSLFQTEPSRLSRKSRQTARNSESIQSTGLHNYWKAEGMRYFEEDFAENFEIKFNEKSNAKNIRLSRNEETDNSFALGEPVSSLKKDDETKIPARKKEIVQHRESRKRDSETHSRSMKKKSSDELVFEDVDETLDDELDNLHLDLSRKPAVVPSHTQSMTLKVAKDLKSLLFGSSTGVFSQEWRNQGFSFCHLDYLKYGIVQHKGGPCGLLASVQAIVLKYLLFPDKPAKSTANSSLRFTSKETSNALYWAFTEILWRAGSYKKAVVTLPSGKDQFVSSAGYKPDGLTEKLLIYGFHDRAELELFIKDNINQLSSDEQSGSILFLYSVILSRSVEKIRQDMDDRNGTFMGAHGYCTQEMVNVIIVGKAVSNTFDNIIELDAGGQTKNILKGIDEQSDIGVLSLFEHYKSYLVGSNLKNPRYPIWVVCSESHFSVLFSTNRNLLSERRAQKRFDLYYYDGLARQDEEIRLTVDTTSARMDELISDDLIPPLELCIRTKWKDAVVDWNGTEPLL